MIKNYNVNLFKKMLHLSSRNQTAENSGKDRIDGMVIQFAKMRLK